MSDPRLRPLTEGAAILLPLAVAGIVAARIAPRTLPISVCAVGGVALAFRDPERAIEPRAGIALAPADGEVIRVERVFDEYWQTDLIEVGIFLALWDVHVQRFPLDGYIEAQQRRAGGYWPAMLGRAVHRNNQFSTYLRTAAGPCTVTQVSGILARRIVTWEQAGSQVMQGQRLGMIKFGSQVTLRLPLTSAVVVEVGEHVSAGVTPIAMTAAAVGDVESDGRRMAEERGE